MKTVTAPAASVAATLATLAAEGGYHPSTKWGYMISRLGDQGRVAHLLEPDNSPACGANYYMSAGASRFVPERQKCGRCQLIEQRRARVRGPALAKLMAGDLDRYAGRRMVGGDVSRSEAVCWMRDRFQDVAREVGVPSEFVRVWCELEVG